ncbi:MAG TPA: LuxR family transcriptional regulator [Deltaproteobacteria bacterium]|nr:LuxR family transcriptional regulator [Deltaproteobacteria bacterium]
MPFLARWPEEIYALTRILFGLLFLCHGLQKILGMFGGAPAGMPTGLLYTAGTIELVGGALIALGLFAGPAAFVCSGEMAVAYFMVHQPQGLVPIQNHGELAVLNCWFFLLLAAKGSGIWSLRASGAAAPVHG